MREVSFLNRVVGQINEVTFKREKTRLVVRMLAISTAVVFCLETLVMLLLEVILKMPQPFNLILDGTIMVVVLFPLNYYFVVRPMANEIENRRKTNQELYKSVEVQDRFFSVKDVLIAYLDADFNFIRVNQGYANADQHEPDYYIGKNHFDLFPNKENQAIFERVVSTGEAVNISEKPFEYKNNPERGISYWDWSLLPVKDPENRVIAILMVLNDVTVRKQAEIALVDSERRFRAVFNQSFHHLGMLDPSGKVLLINQTALDFTGLPADLITGKSLAEAPWWGMQNVSAAPVENAIQQAAAGKMARMEQLVKAADGQDATLAVSIKPLLDNEGCPVLLIYEARDITQRIQAEKALLRSEEKANQLYQAEMRAHQLAETLRSAIAALSRSLDSDTVLETLLDHLYKVVPYSSAHVSLLEDEDHLVVRLARGEDQWDADKQLLGRRFEIFELPFFTPLLKERQIVLVSDTALSPTKSFLPIDGYVLSWIGIPLLAGEHVIGVCLLEHHCPGFFTDDLIHWASALTSQAAVAIQNAWLFEQVRDGRSHLQALSRRLVEVQESERLHIARELHDEAGQSIASLLVGLRLLERDGGDREAVTTHCEGLKQIANGVLENLHRLAIDLRPASLDHLGLVAALRQHTEMISDQYGIAIQFETVGNIERMPGDIETAVYRIVQEALTNVIRHAHATRVDILIERRDDNVMVIVEDNGIGFDPQAHKENQLGLVGMQERAVMLSGTITFESSPGQGTSVLLEVPCPFVS